MKGEGRAEQKKERKRKGGKPKRNIKEENRGLRE